MEKFNDAKPKFTLRDKLIIGFSGGMILLAVGVLVSLAIDVSTLVSPFELP